MKPVSRALGEPFIEQLDPSVTATAAFEALRNEPFSYFLDSGMDPTKLGRFSFVGSSPVALLKTQGESVWYSDARGTTSTIGDPLEALRSVLSGYQIEYDADFPVPFPGGAVGYLSYDLGRRIEDIPCRAVDDLMLPEMCFGFYDRGLVFDHLKGKGYLVSTGFPEREEGERRERAAFRLSDLKKKLGVCAGSASPVAKGLGGRTGACVRSNFARDQYIRAVDRARQYIIDGDIFEVNLSQRFETKIEISPLDLYFRLRSINSAPFACYLGFDDVHVVGASPERFLHKMGRKVETRPIKGTRRRGYTPEEDSRLASELLSSAKDHAENMMIVDLERNDLGRVSQFGTVRVSEMAVLETYPTVFHLTSTVQGELTDGTDCIDLIKATFPGGSITGAPKVRSMEIIEELEPTRRSIYTGSIGYLGFNGNVDLNIVIRSFLIKGDTAYFQAGGAVVYDSDPAEEYQETLDKARALFAALELSTT